jgi:cellulose synthase/poly-beta-1,6-N-acetylglucosamine synthase-like glycosyltransferase
VTETLFWIAVGGVVYPYAGYPLVLWLLGKMFPDRRAPEGTELPAISIIVPVHNEARRLAKKLANTAMLDYPADRLEILFVSDGSTDQSVAMIREAALNNSRVIELPVQGGKAAALNAGLQAAVHPILVFTDASIELEGHSLRQLVKGFADPAVGCISGEDRIAEGGGEGAYGKYEIFLRRLESQLHSIVGASGCFYAQRKAICRPFTEGMAPDFLSVLRTVEQGYRALTEPAATGVMSSVKETRDEFDRKVRTLIRGMTTLFAHPQLLNPFRYGLFAFALWSHKVLRWTVPFFLIITLICSVLLGDQTFYLAAFIAQALFYAGALVALGQLGGLHHSFAGKIALYFSTVNAAILAAWYRYGTGVRQEIWTPSQR